MKTVIKEILYFIGVYIGTYALNRLFVKDFGIAMLLMYGFPVIYLLIRSPFWASKALKRLIAYVKSKKSPTVNRVILAIGVSVAAVVLAVAGYMYKISADLAKSPAAIVIDAETGKPVEGAVALAQWFSAGGGALFEGGVDNLDKAAEAFSDKDGKVYIEGFWSLHTYSGNPRLTVYKPGYVLWDCRRICPTLEGRTDFDENHRVVKLLKFDAEAGRWVKEYPNRGGGKPHEMQDSFYSHCYDSEVNRKYSRNEIKFDDIFYKHELPFLDKERKEKIK